MTTQGCPEGLAKAPSVGKWEELTLAHLTVGRTEVCSDPDPFTLPLNAWGWLEKGQSQAHVHGISFCLKAPVVSWGLICPVLPAAFLPFLRIFEAPVIQGGPKYVSIWIYLLSTVDCPDLALPFSCTSLLFWIRIYSQAEGLFIDATMNVKRKPQGLQLPHTMCVCGLAAYRCQGAWGRGVSSRCLWSEGAV